MQDRCDLVTLALNSGANTNIEDGRPLTEAIQLANYKLVKLLLERGADPNAQNSRPLIEAIKLGRSNLVQLLLEWGADPNAQNGQPLIVALECFNLPAAHLLLDNGANPNAQNGKPLINAFGICRQRYSSICTDDKIYALFSCLIDKGAEVNGNALINSVIEEIRPRSVFELLLSASNAPDYFLHKVLLEAIILNRTDIIEILNKRNIHF